MSNVTSAFNLNNIINTCFNKSPISFMNLDKIYVLGNVSYDLDSFLSSFLLSLSRNLIQNIKSDENNINYLPLINCEKPLINARFDIKYLNDNYNLNIKNMPFYSDKLIQNDLINNDKSKVILVDHNIPDVTQMKILKNKIIEIYDHHKDSNFTNKNDIKKLIKYPLGSCTTLILKKYFLPNKFLFKYIDPLLSVSSILIDTDNFNMKLYNKKWVDDDRKVFESIMNINKNKYNKGMVNKFYKKLNDLKYDEELNLGLGTDIILKKDKKNFSWRNYNEIFIYGGYSVFQVSFKKIINRYGCKNLFRNIEDVCNTEKFSIYLCHYTSKCYDWKNNKIRCLKVIFYNHSMETCKFDDLISRVKRRLGDSCYKIKKENLNNDKYYYKMAIHPSLTRKHLEPIINSIFSELN